MLLLGRVKRAILERNLAKIGLCDSAGADGEDLVRLGCDKLRKALDELEDAMGKRSCCWCCRRQL